jgi:phosphoribosylaminoimidazolecarboxamide formyltransferase/IMP cyclohydrolase
MLKDIKLLFHLASLTNNEFLGFAKKGIFVFGYCAPTQEEKKQFIRIIKELKGGIVYSDDPNIIFELKDSKHDGMMTSYNLEQKEEIISFKPMVFKVNKKVLKQEEEYIVDSDLVVKQNFQEISLDLSPSEQLGFEVAKIHKSDTAVYVKNNLICSGNQSCLNREIALNALENTLEKFEVLPKEGTIIFDSPINSEKITDIILNWQVEKVIVPPTLPGYEKYLNDLEEKGVTLLVTQGRYHRY